LSDKSTKKQGEDRRTIKSKGPDSEEGKNVVKIPRYSRQDISKGGVS